jgi:hypothetical protein
LTPEQKAEKEKLEQIEREIQNRNRSIKEKLDCKSNGKINPPTRFFSAGEQVKYGGFTRSYIVNKIDDEGYIYEIRTISEKKAHLGQKEDVESTSIVSWYNIFKYVSQEEMSQRPIISKKFHYGRSLNTTLESLIHRYYADSAGVDMNPEYQRGYVWTLEDKQNLIRSILNDIEIGRFVFMQKDFSSEDPHFYEIIDGKQRLSTLIEFYEDSDLSFKDQHAILEKQILIIDTPQLTEKEKYEYFIRINTTGKVMDQEHIEKVKELLNKS